jgi:DNA-binding NtrC family response regulator
MQGTGLKRLDVAERRMVHLRKSLRALLDEAKSKTYDVEIDPEVGLDYYESIKNYEKAMIESALSITSGKQKDAADLLNLARSTLCMKIKQFEIDVSAF